MRLTEMKGASLLPVKKDIVSLHKLGVETTMDYCTGNNEAVTQLEQCSVEVDCEELENIIRKSSISSQGYFQFIPKEIAQELSKCKQNWLVLELCKD